MFSEKQTNKKQVDAFTPKFMKIRWGLYIGRVLVNAHTSLFENNPIS